MSDAPQRVCGRLDCGKRFSLVHRSGRTLAGLGLDESAVITMAKSTVRAPVAGSRPRCVGRGYLKRKIVGHWRAFLSLELPKRYLPPINRPAIRI